MVLTDMMVREYLGKRFASQFAALGFDPNQVPEDLDLLERGVIDSLGLIELIAAVDEEFNLAVDFEQMDPEHLTIVGPFCRYVAAASAKP